MSTLQWEKEENNRMNRVRGVILKETGCIFVKFGREVIRHDFPVEL
jgi:hypothetical protein